MTIRKKAAVVFVGVALIAAVLTGCGQAAWEDSLRDLEGVQVYDPDEATLWNNVDQHPNIVRLCLDGVAFATTTRPDFAAVTRVPEWDAHCKTVQGRGKKMTN
jgi:predicted small secreted protein